MSHPPLYSAVICGLLLAPLWLLAAERAPLDPTLLSWEAGEGITIPDPEYGDQAPPPPWYVPVHIERSLLGGEGVASGAAPEAAGAAPGRFMGGMRLLYEAVRLDADRIAFWQTPLLPTSGRAWPQRVLILPGDSGPEPDRVHLDSRYSELPSINVTGLLRPRRMSIDRQSVTSSNDTVVFRIHLQEVDDFRMEIRAADGSWHTVTGFADEMLVMLHADQLGDTLSEPRIATLHMLARPLGADSGAGRMHLTYWHPRRPARIDSRRVSMYFDDAGQLHQLQTGAHTEMRILAADAEPPDLPAYHIASDPQLEARKQQRRSGLQ